MLDPVEILQRIDLEISKDQGAAYDRLLQQQLKKLMAQVHQPLETQGRIGASEVGAPCDRYLYYTYHQETRPPHCAQLLRIFSRGKYEEARLLSCLKLIGLTVLETDDNNQQFSFSFFNGKFTGHTDGIIIDENDDKYVLEMKTSNTQIFQKLRNRGVEEVIPKHYAQIQAYMLGLKIDNAFYFVVDKNTDLLYIELIQKNLAYCTKILTRVDYILHSEEEHCFKISPYPSYIECKFCPFKNKCHNLKGYE